MSPEVACHTLALIEEVQYEMKNIREESREKFEAKRKVV